MYSTCLFCYSDLGKNESIEHFPIGRRLAFDPARGRLWVVCRKCERWNLTPLEQRWEGIEDCERLFTRTKLRASTDQIGLTRLRDGTELVRIGQPQRPEMAAWRYGDQFGRRRMRTIAYSAGVLSLSGAVVVAGPLLVGAVSGVCLSMSALSFVNSFRQQRKVIARITLPESDKPYLLTAQFLRHVSISSTDGELSLVVPLEKHRSLLSHAARQVGEIRQEVFTGEHALRTAAKLLPAINSNGGSRTTIRDASSLIERTTDAHALIRPFTGQRTLGFGPRGRAPFTQSLQSLPVHARLALEMVLHEESERRALEGELRALEAAWQEAEEIASIADGLLVSADVRQRLSSMKSEDDR